MRQWLIGITIACMPLLADASARLNSCRIQERNHTTQIHLRTTNPVTYHTFSLNSPSRLVIDLDHTITTKHPCRIVNAPTLVKSIRTGHPSPSLFRLVIDLKQPAKHVTLHHQITPNHKELFFTLTSTKHHQLTRVEQAAKPLWPTRTKQQIIPEPPITPERTVIVIDPGHGGKDPGATGARGYHEKDIVLSIAKRLQKDINRYTPYRAVLTRRSDYYLTLRQRLKFARDHHARLFISVHADAFHRRRAHGASVFALSERGASSEAAHWLASKENASELLGGVSLDDKTMLLKSVLIDLSQSASVRESMDLGKRILTQLDNVTNLHHNKVEEAAFVVLKSPDIPSLLIETGFLSNPREERSLIRRGYQEKLAMAITQGIKRYMQTQHSRHHNNRK